MSPQHILVSWLLMFTWFNYYTRALSVIHVNIVQKFSYYYLLILAGVLCTFLSYRLPYVYSPWGFVIILVCLIFARFLSMFLWRVRSNIDIFFSRFIPVGTPLYICPLVCIAETISYIIRPFVLVFRPFIKISLGCFGAVAISSFCFSSTAWFFALGLLFFYEVFVALVHWFIVTNILAFSVDH